MIPEFVRKFFNFTNEENRLVNLNNTIADERGVDYIKVNP